MAGDLIPTSRWERISRTANVVAGDDWSRRLDAYIVDQQTIHDRESQVDDPRPGVLDRAQRTIEAATALRAFATALRDTLKQGHTLTTWSELSTWALDLSHRLLDSERQLARLPLEEQSAAAAVEQALTGLTSLDALEQRADLPTLRDVLAVQLEASLPRVGRFGDGVFVAPLSASVGLDVDVVYVVGLAEDIVPGRLHEDALLPEHARDATGGELAAFRDRLDDRHRQLLAALAAGAHRVVASFPRGDLRRSTQRLPSRWLIPTFRELSGDHELPATRWADVGNPAWLVGSESHAGTMQTLDHPASEQEWRVRAASASHPLDDPAVDAGTVMTNARAGHALTRFDGDLTAVNGMPDYARHDIAASPTSLESYVACPHAWFVKRLLRIEPVEQPEELVTISSADIGNLMHEAMDALVRAFGDELPTYGGEWTAQQKLRLQKLAAELADDFEQRGLTGHPRLWAHQRIRIMADLAWMLDNDTTWRRGRDARVIASEMAIGMRGHEAVEIPVPGGRVRMAGSEHLRSLAQQELGAGDHTVELTTNFRTTGPILDWVNAVFANVITPIDHVQPAYLPLDPHRGDSATGPSVLVVGAEAHADDPNADTLREREAADVATVIRRALDETWTVWDERSDAWRPIRLGDVAVLVPARTSLPFLEEALDTAGVSYRAESSSLVYQAQEVRDLLAAARAVADPSDALALVTALRSPLFGCGDDDLWTWKQAGRGFNLLAPPDDALREHPVGAAMAYLKQLYRDAQWLTPSEVLGQLVADRRILEVAAMGPRARDQWRRLRFVVDQARAWSEVEHGGLRAYLAWAARQGEEASRVAEAVLPETDTDAVRVMTVHAAKGLEFPMVVLSGMSAQPRGRAVCSCSGHRPVGMRSACARTCGRSTSTR